jgi:hypothetical protein
VAKTRAVLNGLLHVRPDPTGIVPPGILRNFDILFAHFGIPKDMPFTPSKRDTVRNLQDFLRLIDQVYQQVAENLAKASTLFLDPPPPPWGPSITADTFAATVGADKDGFAPPVSSFPNGMYFFPRFLTTPDGTAVGPHKQTEVIVHESGHFPNETMEIKDLVVPGDPGYANEPANKRVNNAYSYSQFAMHVNFGRAEPFDDDE